MASLKMPREVAEHEVAHLIGAAVAWMGDDAPRGLKFFCDHPRYHDAQAFLGYDAAAQQGEFAVVVAKHSPQHGDMDDAQLALIRRSSAIAPIGLAHDGNRVLRCLKEAKSWYDIISDFSDILSPEDRSHAIKGSPLIKRHEELVGVVAFQAAKTVAPGRVKGIVDVVVKHDGVGGTLPVREFIPRALAQDICAEALKMSRTLYEIAKA